MYKMYYLKSIKIKSDVIGSFSQASDPLHLGQCMPLMPFTDNLLSCAQSMKGSQLVKYTNTVVEELKRARSNEK